MIQKFFLSSVMLFLLVACSNEQPAAQSTQPAASAALTTPATTEVNAHQAENFKLIFFLDPNGRPCQMQHAILMEMAEELKAKASVHYVKTTVDSHRDVFYQYGVRSLPLLLLADSSGKEIKRMSPGVKKADDIRNLLNSIPRS